MPHSWVFGRRFLLFMSRRFVFSCLGGEVAVFFAWCSHAVEMHVGLGVIVAPRAVQRCGLITGLPQLRKSAWLPGRYFGCKAVL